jgi:hypothetical protein
MNDIQPQIVKAIIRQARMNQAMYAEHSETADEVMGRSNNDKLISLADHIERECVWTKTIMGNYGEYDCWATECGEDFAIEEEWHENPTTYCAHCGGKTVATEESE